MVGSRGTGKSSLLRLLLETAEVSPSATKEQRAALAKFLRDSSKPTSGIHSAAVEICESKFDRILLSVIDTPGLDFQEGKELKLERQLSAILKHVDAQYADTMNEVSYHNHIKNEISLLTIPAHIGIQGRSSTEGRPTCPPVGYYPVFDQSSSFFFVCLVAYT